MTNFDFGLLPTFYLSLISSAYLIYKVISIRPKNSEFPIIQIIVVVSISCATIYPIINFIINFYYSLTKNYLSEFLNSEFSQILAWRFSSVYIGIKSLFSVQIYNFKFCNIKHITDDYFKKYPELEKIQYTQNSDSILLYVIFSNLFYLFSLLFLGLHYVFIGINEYSKIYSFLVLFILDDWSIISFYYLASKGRVSNLHNIKLNTLKLSILSLATFITFREFNISLPSISMALICIFIVLSYIYSNTFKNFYKIEYFIKKASR